jgi:ABC-2 type transport system permease protein
MTTQTATQDLTLRDIPGPSALGGGWRRALELLSVIAINDFKKTYFGTALGYLWSLARPLMLFGVLLTVFTIIVRFANIPHYPELLLMNIVLFTFFQESTVMAVGSVVGAEAIVRKTQFPRLVIPLAVVLTSLFNLLLNLVIVVIFLLAAGVTPTWTWLLFPIILVALIAVTVPVAMIVSSLYPRFRDVAIIWTVLSTALFYGSPIFYTLDVTTVSTHPALRHILEINPLTPILELARKWVVQGDAPAPGAVGGALAILGPLVIFAVIWVAAIVIFNREAPRIAEQL